MDFLSEPVTADKPPDMKELRGRITAMIRDSVARHPELVAAYDSRKK